MYEYEIAWNTKPSPGSTYYNGTSKFQSNHTDLTIVEDQFLNSLKRSGWHPSEIIIRSITRKNK